MNEIERATLNEILRTVIYIAEKIDKKDNHSEDTKSSASSAS